MALIEIPVANLLGGVSQQPAANRTPGQLEGVDNAILHVVNGAGKRPGTRHLDRLLTGQESVLATHFTNRDETERYLFLIGERRLRVFDATDGTEFPVRVNGSSTAAGRGETSSGAPLNYLDPRTPDGVVDQDEDFVIGAGDWLSVAGNSATSYVSGRGPFKFGRRQSISSVTADTVALVGNGAVSSVSDIYQTFGVFAIRNLLTVYAKKNSAAINDFELTLSDGTVTDYAGARFDVSSGGVITVGALVTTGASNVTAEVEDAGNGWYRCTVRVLAAAGLPPPGDLIAGEARRVRIRFHTNAATPESKNLLLFGCRCYDNVLASEPVPPYIYDRFDLIRPLTIADTTLLLNTEVTVGALTGTTPTSTTFGIVFVKTAGFEDVDYTVSLRNSGGTTRSYTHTPATLADANSEAIAAALVALINADPYYVATTTTGVNSTIRIVSGTETLATIEVNDSRGDSLMIGFVSPTGRVQRFTDLPLDIGASSAYVTVSGSPEDSVDDYYVRFALNPGSTSGARGFWSEAAQPGIGLSLPATSLPLRVRRLQDDAAGTITGTPSAIYFDVGEIDWDDRLVGDDDTNPAPGFIGQKIRDIFQYRGRLGFLAAEKVILSETSELFNFWRSTTLSLPDTDPIEVTAGTRDVATLWNAAATADALVVAGERSQFSLLGDPNLTPSTAQLAALRSFEVSIHCRPVDAGRGAVFARPLGPFSGLLEFSLLQDDATFRVDDVFQQAPRYVEGDLVQLAHSSLAGLTVARAADPTVLYVHQSFFDDQENRLQSAPHRWLFAPDTAIRGVGFLESELRLVVERDEGWFLETLDVSPTIDEDGTPRVYLDRRVDETQAVVSYDGGTDTTTIGLPYDLDPDAEYVVIDRSSGLAVTVTGQGTDYLEVHGELESVYAGEAFTMRLTLTEPVLQAPGPRGGIIPRTGRPLDVHRLYLYVAETAFLEVHVAPDLRTTSVEEFSSAGLGTGLLLAGELGVYTGDADFAILGLSTELEVSIVNDSPFPSFIQSARWEILNQQRTSFA